MQVFKGFVETKDKKCIEKFKGRTDFTSYSRIKVSQQTGRMHSLQLD